MIDMSYDLNGLIGLIGNASTILYQGIAAMTGWFFSISGHLLDGVLGSWLGWSRFK